MRRSLVVLCLLCSGCLFGRWKPGEVHLRDEMPPPGPGFDLALYQTTGVPMTSGNAVRWLWNGDIFDAAVADIGKAQHSINIVTFIWTDGKVSDRIIDAIAPRVKAGATCRILVDSLGTLNPPKALTDKIQHAGCDLRFVRPIPGQDDVARNHRKMLIVDGRVGFTGGYGIDDRWLGDGRAPDTWRDSAVHVEGPVVAQMQQAFAENWQEAGGALLPAEDFPQLAPAGPARAAFVGSTENSIVTKADRLMQLLFGTARERLWITNAYFVPSDPILGKLSRRAKEGVDVRVLAAGDKTDSAPYLPPQRSRLRDLEQGGVHAFEYRLAMMHAKTVLVDGRVVAVGSCNLDALSLNKLDEGELIVDDADFAAQLAAQFARDVADSKAVDR